MVAPEKPRLAISFSGGRSSAVMLKRCLERFDDTHDILITFANTGCEDERTLDFVHAVDQHFADGRVVWIEGEFHESGKGPTARVVTYETASRGGEPFRAAVEKHGVFCSTHPQCTSRLKEEPMIAYRRSCGWDAGTYDTAIGIRYDEADRCSSKAREKRFIYPLVQEKWRKRDVNRFMVQFDWDLNLPNDAWGNCVWFWKKSFRKLMTVAKHEPDAFDFPGEMERRFGTINRGDQPQPDPRVFFRDRHSAQDIVKRAFTESFIEYADDKYEQQELFDDWWDVGSGCGESCEVGADS